MKLLSALLTTAGLISTAQACFKVHAILYNDPFRGDAMTIQIVNDDGAGSHTEMCRRAENKIGASDQTVWIADCGEYYAEVTDNGRSGFMEVRPGGGEARRYMLDSKDSEYRDWPCGGGDEPAYTCSVYATCFHARESCGSTADLGCPLCHEDWRYRYCQDVTVPQVQQ